MRVNMNKTKVMISGKRQKVMLKAARWPCGVCGRGVCNNPNSVPVVDSESEIVQQLSAKLYVVWN